MHDTALEIGSKFLAIYANVPKMTVVEIGAMDINGSLRSACPESATYLGIDVTHGKSVDLVADPNKPLPLRSGFADLLISTSQMEHDPKFWVTFLDLCRIVKNGGFIYMNAPSNGWFHRYPVDIWRFYPDAGKALAQWAADNGHPVALVESFTARRKKDMWNDFISVFYIGEWPAGRPVDFLSDHCDARNIWRIGETGILNQEANTEDQSIIADLKRQIASLEAKLETSRVQIASLETSAQKIKNKASSAEATAAK